MSNFEMGKHKMHGLFFKKAGTGQQMGTPGGAPVYPRSGPAAGTNPFQGFAPKSPFQAPQYNIHNPSPEQAKLNSGFAKQKADVAFKSKVNDTLSGASGRYNNVPGMSDKQREMANYKDFRQGYQQDKSAPTTEGVKGEAIKIDQENDQRAVNIMGTSLLGGTATNVIAPRIANLPFKAWAAARSAFPTFNTGVISPVLKTVTDYANATPKVPIR